jgi:tetratricopeptide (TPR) repeat protein
MWRCELLTILVRHEESLQACRQGLALDPLAPVAHNQYGSALIWAAQHVEGRAAITRAIEFDPGFDLAARNLLLSYLLDRDFDGWLRLARQAAASPEERSVIARLHAGWSRPDDLDARAGALSAIDNFRARTGETELHIAAVMLMLLGERERTLATLEEAANVPHLRPYLPYINVGRHFDPITHDRRYQDLRRTMNLEHLAR